MRQTIARAGIAAGSIAACGTVAYLTSGLRFSVPSAVFVLAQIMTAIGGYAVGRAYADRVATRTASQGLSHESVWVQIPTPYRGSQRIVAGQSLTIRPVVGTLPAVTESDNRRSA